MAWEFIITWQRIVSKHTEKRTEPTAVFLIILGRPGSVYETSHVPTRPEMSFSLTTKGTGWPQMIAAIVLPPYEFIVSSTSPCTNRIFGVALRTAVQLAAQ